MKALLLLLFFFPFSTSFSQESEMHLSVVQDIRLIAIGDDKGNSPFTTDILIHFELNVFEFKKSRFPFLIGLEYSDLKSANYHRFFIGFGYVVEFSFLKKFNFGWFINHGIIFRGKGFHPANKKGENSFMSLGVGIETTYPITNKLRLSLIYQAIDRNDLAIRFGTERNIKGSVFLGVKFAL